jgi:two-component system NtrC family sensor kinase
MALQTPLTILFVDDSPEDRAIYRRYLSQQTTTTYTCIEAATGAEGLQACQTAQPDCIVLDFSLPDMTGVEFLHTMQAAHDVLAIPVVMLTGQGSEQLAVQVLQQGAQDYLVKGQLTADSLQHAITTACNTVRLRQELAAHQQSLRLLNATLEQRVAERTALLELMQDITRAANEGSSSAEVLQYAVQRICAYIRWPVGHAWLAVTPDGSRWAPTMIWHLDAHEPLTIFQQATQSLEFSAGEGLIGQVGALGKAVWSMDITTDPAFSRRQAALAAGLVTGFAIPLLVGPEVVGVLEFYATERQGPDVTLLEALAQMGTQLGRAVERERAIAQAQHQQAALFQREKLAAMGSLLASVAHELNNPLAIILLQADTLQEEAAREPLAGYVAEITQAARRCERLVRQFLTLARQHAPERATVELNTLLTDTLELLAPAFRVDMIDVDLRLTPALPSLYADPHQLQQVLVNLLTNAQQALRDVPVPRRLTLTTHCDPGRTQITLEVADNGPGMLPQVQGRIFEPFFTTKPPGVGTGLGLPLCLGIIEGHGGTIQVRSVPGHGSTFQVVLPMVEVLETPPTIAALHDLTPMRGQTILLVDDEPGIVSALTRVLRRDGHIVDTAANGRQALARIEGRVYDLILSDLRMPELDGPGLYRALEQQYPALCRRFLFLTGDTLSAETLAFFEQTGAPRLIKPFGTTGVRRAIQQVLGAE